MRGKRNFNWLIQTAFRRTDSSKTKLKGLPSLRRIASHIPARTAEGHHVDASHDRHRYRLRSIGCANLQPPRSFADRCAH